MFERPHHQRIALVLQSLDSEHRAGQPHKLLANSDRWADDSVFSRDLIDLAMNAPRAMVWQNLRALRRRLPR